jgi:hypothetical protein
MSREKNKVTKRMSPENSPSENHKLAQFGKFWETTEFVQAWHWRYMLALCAHPDASKDKGTKTAMINEIGEAVGKAIAKGDWRYLESLAEATKFLNERCDWRLKTHHDFWALSRFDVSKFRPIDRLRMLIVNEYFLTRGDPMDEAKKSRKAFMKYIKALMPRSYELCERTFDRACKSVGIGWQKKSTAS